MDLKIIMVPFGGDDSETGALKTALDLAHTHLAHVEVWYISPNPYEMVTVFYPGYGIAPMYSEETVSELKTTYERARDAARQKFLTLIEEAGVGYVGASVDAPGRASASFHFATGSAHEIFPVHARLADLAVISRATSEKSEFFQDVVYSALFNSARPVLFVPAGSEASAPEGKSIVAWNGSAEASRAVAFSLPLLGGDKVWVWTESEKKSPPAESSAGNLLDYLKCHGISAEEISSKNLLPEAKTLGASMIVMGAYGHSRFRETIMGGMTDYMIKHADIPVLMAH